MHSLLDRVWMECRRVLVPGGFACVNIGDALRTLPRRRPAAGTTSSPSPGGLLSHPPEPRFRLYPNHARIIEAFRRLGFDALPEILWRKQTNAPNKFMGSGMLPAGAYVTLEHEFILVFRKEGKRNFTAAETANLRRTGACFWEERNRWYSDLWDFKGIRQTGPARQNPEQPENQGRQNESKESADPGRRKRSAAFPFELARRLVLMYSLPGDTVADPFLGTGTTLLACIAAARGCAGYEINPACETDIVNALNAFAPKVNAGLKQRLRDHCDFADERAGQGKALRFINEVHGFPVMTRQELRLSIPYIKRITFSPGGVDVLYELKGRDWMEAPPPEILRSSRGGMA
jgi:DNA modification methylase